MQADGSVYSRHSWVLPALLAPPPPPFAPFRIEVDNDATRHGFSVIAKQPTNTWNTQWVIGASYEAAEVVDHFQKFFTPAGVLFLTAPGAQEGIDRTTRSLFVQARTSFLDGQAHVLYGGRLDDFSDFGVERSPAPRLHLPAHRQVVY